MTYSSRIDWCVLAAITLAIAAILLGASYWSAGPVLLILLLWAYPKSYVTTPSGLLVHDALSRRLIPYAAITLVSPRRGRIRIQHGPASELVVAPLKADLFLRDLAARMPHLIKRENDLVLRDRYMEYRMSAFRPAIR